MTKGIYPKINESTKNNDFFLEKFTCFNSLIERITTVEVAMSKKDAGINTTLKNSFASKKFVSKTDAMTPILT